MNPMDPRYYPYLKHINTQNKTRTINRKGIIIRVGPQNKNKGTNDSKKD